MTARQVMRVTYTDGTTEDFEADNIQIVDGNYVLRWRTTVVATIPMGDDISIETILTHTSTGPT